MKIICSAKGTEVYADEEPEELCAFHEWQILICSACECVNVLQHTEWEHESYLMGFDDDGEEVWQQHIDTLDLLHKCVIIGT